MSIGFIGAGNLARAIVLGILEKGVFSSQEVSCISGSGKTARALSLEAGIGLSSSRLELLNQSNTVILAFKPQHLDTITEEEGNAAKGSLLISVLAGRTLASLRSAFPLARNVVRVMPNTPSRIGKGVSAYCFENPPTKDDREIVESMLGALGASYEVNEPQMHIVTAVSGCGPAVFFQFIDFVAQAAETHGLERSLATQLAIETGIGSLELMKQSGQLPSELVDEVVSPNGVTHALLESLKSADWSETIHKGIDKAVNRSEELSRPAG